MLRTNYFSLRVSADNLGHSSKYHQSVERWRGSNQPTPTAELRLSTPQTQGDHPPPLCRPQTRLMAPRFQQSGSTYCNQLMCSLTRAVVEVAVKDHTDGPYPTPLDCGLYVDPSLLQVEPDHIALTVLCNPTGCSMFLDRGSVLGEAVPATVV